MVHYSTLQKEKGETLATKEDLGPASLEEMTMLLVNKGQARVFPALSLSMYRIQRILLTWTPPDSLKEYLLPLSYASEKVNSEELNVHYLSYHSYC